MSFTTAGAAIGTALLPGIGTGIGAVGGAIGDFFAGQSSAQQQNSMNMEMLQQQQIFSANQAQRQMEYQTSMSNTAYQRSVADMKAAGINPLMAYTQGGASTPGGASGSLPSSPTVESPLAAGLNSAKEFGDSYMNYQLKKEALDTAKENTHKSMEDAEIAMHTNTMAKQDARIKKATADAVIQRTKSNAKQASADADISGGAAQKAKAQGDFWKEDGKTKAAADYYFEKAAQTAGALNSARKAATP